MNDFSHSLCLDTEGRMPQAMSNISGHFLLFHVQPDQTIGAVTKFAFEEVLVLREKCWAFQPVKQWQNVLILNARMGNFLADLSEWDSPLPQKRPLIVADVFVQEVHAARWPFNLRFNRPRASSRALPAKRIVSRTALLLTRPPHAFTS